MKNMKKFAALLLTAAMTVAMVGCGSSVAANTVNSLSLIHIFKSIIPEIAKRNFAGIMLVVANPVDILTQVEMCIRDRCYCEPL